MLCILLWVVMLWGLDSLERGISVANVDFFTVWIGVTLAVYSLPFWCVYALIMITSNAKRNIDGLKKSVTCCTGLGFLVLFLSQTAVALLAVGVGAVLGAFAVLLLPKSD